MKIYQCSPYYNEQLIANINLEEASQWIDEFHITESNRGFQGKNKEYNFINNKDFDKLRYHKIDVDNIFINNNKLGKIKLFKYRFSNNRYKNEILRSPSWYNEAMQRNNSCSCLEVDDKDIIILSDIDEIIDSRYADRIVEEVKKRGIVTIKVHFTLFYLNLFSLNWGGPPNYSYRIFIMTGKYFKNMKFTSDELRKLGEKGSLYNEIYCIDDICGFHHSWLGDENFIFNKIKSYAHTEHSEFADIDYIKKCIKEGKSIFPGHKLEIRDDIKFIRSIERNRDRFLKDYFL